MNHIIYLLDSLAPTSLVNSLSKKFSFKKKANYIDKLSSKSIFFTLSKQVCKNRLQNIRNYFN